MSWISDLLSGGAQWWVADQANNNYQDAFNANITSLQTLQNEARDYNDEGTFTPVTVTPDTTTNYGGTAPTAPTAPTLVTTGSSGYSAPATGPTGYSTVNGYTLGSQPTGYTNGYTLGAQPTASTNSYTAGMGPGSIASSYVAGQAPSGVTSNYTAGPTAQLGGVNVNLPGRFQGGVGGPANVSLNGMLGFSGFNIPQTASAAQYNAPGQVNTNLQQSALYNAQAQSPQYSQGQIASGLLGGLTAQDALSQLGGGTGRSEQEIYDMLEGMQSGDRERERLALRDELAAQGRLGTASNAYGGTPEELARAKAVEEARGANAMRAFQLAGEEQGRLATQRLQAMGLGEESAGRQNQNLLQSFGLGTESQNAATNLTNVLGEQALQGRSIGNQFQQGLLSAALNQRGQDVQAGTSMAGINNQYNLGMFGAQTNAQAQQAAATNAYNQVMAQLYGTDVGAATQARGQDVQMQNVLANVYGTDVNAAVQQGQLGLEADRNTIAQYQAQQTAQAEQGRQALQAAGINIDAFRAGDAAAQAQGAQALQAAGINVDAYRAAEQASQAQSQLGLQAGQQSIDAFNAYNQAQFQQGQLGVQAGQQGIDAFNAYNQGQYQQGMLGVEAGNQNITAFNAFNQAQQEAARLGLLADQNAISNYNAQANYNIGMGGVNNTAYANSFLSDRQAFDYAQLNAETQLNSERNQLVAEGYAQTAGMNEATLAQQAAEAQMNYELGNNQLIVDMLLGTINDQTGQTVNTGLLEQWFPGLFSG